MGVFSRGFCFFCPWREQKVELFPFPEVLVSRLDPSLPHRDFSDTPFFPFSRRRTSPPPFFATAFFFPSLHSRGALFPRAWCPRPWVFRRNIAFFSGLSFFPPFSPLTKTRSFLVSLRTFMRATCLSRHAETFPVFPPTSRTFPSPIPGSSTDFRMVFSGVLFGLFTVLTLSP